MKKNEKKDIPEYSRKASHKGKACRRGEPVYYEARKEKLYINLTPLAKTKLKDLAIQHGISRSEVIERWLRDLL
ncbi:hypothetical protein [Pseudanabaena sp. FACHB-2040]|uniref:hypothetical protein n=1 Tax=Pseudanabaena sp. FACHB-2040 TaxID=2692859 RepID=UPI0016899E0E|nr:hypothetical protein [Pseudanabaena sp. FACHB-2040]MBD2261085.1 hypothetical protein [Pseudanabaena sp. FACHB-2040]